MAAPVQRQILIFAFAGGVGFLIEAGIIHYGVTYLSLDAQMPRLVSYPLALVWTWYINRTYGFGVMTKPNWREFIRFVQSNFVAQLTNIGLYLIMTSWSDRLAQSPLIALVIATAISMCVSFALYRFYAFSGRASGE